MSDFRRDRRPSCARWTEKIGSRKAAFFNPSPRSGVFIAAPQALLPFIPTPCGSESKGPFSFAKENGPFGTPRERLGLAVSSLNILYASGMGIPARGVAAVSVAIRFAAASIIRCCAAVGGSAALRMRHTPCGCRSACLVVVQPNFRLLTDSSMRRAQQCRYFARSLPPF